MISYIIEVLWDSRGKWAHTFVFLTLLGGLGGCQVVSPPPLQVPLEAPSREGSWDFHVHSLLAPHREELMGVWGTCMYPYPGLTLTYLPPVPLGMCLSTLRPSL